MTIRRQFSTIVSLWRVRQAVSAGDPVKTLRVAESAAGLSSDDYASAERLRRKLERYVDGMPGLLAVTYVSTLSGALGMVRRNLDGLRVFEAFLGIDAGDYTHAGALREKIRARSKELPDDMAVLFVFSLAGSLGVLGRESEGVALLRADLGLDPPDPAQDGAAVLDGLKTKVLARLAGLMPDTVATYLSLLVTYLDGLGVGADGVAILEAYLGLQADDYRSAARLSARLDPFLGSLTTREAPVSLIMTLAALLGEDGRPEQGLALVEWRVGADAAGYRDVDALTRAWRSFCDRNYPDMGPTFWRVWTDLLAQADRPDDVFALIEADGGMRLADLSASERFGPKLAERLRRSQGDTAAAYIVSLAHDLVGLGYAGQAGAVTDWYLRGYDNLWNVPDQGDPGVRHVIPLVALWLELRSAAEPDFAWELSGQAVVYLRRSQLVEDLQLADRREFIGYVEELRGQIKQVGYSWAPPGTSYRAEWGADLERVLQAQLWDAELGQRALFEEFLLTSVPPVLPGSPPEDRWPYIDEEPVDAGPPEFLQAGPEALLRLLGNEGPGDVTPTRAAGLTDDVDPADEAWLREAEQLVRQGVTEDLLAETFGPGAVLVRAGFRPGDGALVWSALRTGGADRVRVVAAGIGSPGDQLRAHWASLRHDLGLQMATAVRAERSGDDSSLAQLGGRGESQGDRLAAVLADTLDDMMAVLDEVIASDQKTDKWARIFAGQLGVLDSPRSSIGLHGRVGSRIGGLLPLPAYPAQRAAWAHFARTELDALRHAAWRHLESMRRVSGIPDEIDEVTQAYLSEIAQIWPLATLTEQLDLDTDVIFQLEDVLQQVPVAHYPTAAGVPLFAQVRSTRVSLSVLVTIMQARAELRFATDARRMMAVSYFGENDASGTIVRALHYAARWLARQAPGGPFTCLNAAAEPPGSVGALQAALRSGPGFQTVTVCGHGFADEDRQDRSARSGIRLRDGLWTGTGCDLSSVNFLLLPSCSMGKLRQAGDGDVTGMCALLALNRARSVLACRWPVLTDQAIAFAHEVAADYLALSARPEERDRGALRARAVNMARHHFLDHAGAAPDRSGLLLNTVAAFELFGLG